MQMRSGILPALGAYQGDFSVMDSSREVNTEKKRKQTEEKQNKTWILFEIQFCLTFEIIQYGF